MFGINKILAPTDLSNLSLVGLRYAFNLAQALGAEVIVYHVVDANELMHYSGYQRHPVGTDPTLHPPSDALEAAKSALLNFLDKNLGDLLPLVETKERVEMGAPDKNIVERAQADKVDLIVISTHGRTGLSHMLLGSVTERVVRTAPCPVVSIHPSQVATTEKKEAASS